MRSPELSTRHSSDLPHFPACRILGSRVRFLPAEEVAAILAGWIDSWRGEAARQVVVTGFHGLWEAHQSPELRRVLNSADLWVADGIAPVWVARLRGLRNVKRTPGAEIMQAFFRLAQQKGLASFFYGDTEETLVALRRRLEADYPGHRIAGTISPPFRPLAQEEDARYLEQINESGAHVLWVGLGTPKQDRWIWERRLRLRVPVAVGVGAAFRFVAGTVRRCPRWMGEAGFEWLWRLACEPRKLWRRDFLDGPRFVYEITKELVLAGGNYTPDCESKDGFAK
jgi:N-acetylglucosaminyldiphosphoundecaprenol N-acetyl-beta-D-mannosaminyltransferase